MNEGGGEAGKEGRHDTCSLACMHIRLSGTCTHAYVSQAHVRTHTSLRHMYALIRISGTCTHAYVSQAHVRTHTYLGHMYAHIRLSGTCTYTYVGLNMYRKAPLLLLLRQRGAGSPPPLPLSLSLSPSLSHTHTHTDSHMLIQDLGFSYTHV